MCTLSGRLTVPRNFGERPFKEEKEDKKKGRGQAKIKDPIFVYRHVMSYIKEKRVGTMVFLRTA